jgi:hypothetical protein
MLYVCGCYESELCFRVIRDVFIPLKKYFLNGSKLNETALNISVFVQYKLLFATNDYTVDQLSRYRQECARRFERVKSVTLITQISLDLCAPML